MARPRKTAAPLATDNVRRIRSRYATALQFGYTVEEAATLANGSEAIVPKEGRSLPEPGLPNEVLTQTVKLSGTASEPDNPEPKSNIDIPPNWEDLPWPALKVLAESLNGGRDVKSRKQAGEIITKALR